MPNFCLVPQLAEKFKKDILEGRIDPIKLSEMTSQERHAFFSDNLGEHNASPVNALFESKLLLKNQQQGYVTWAKKLTGISKEAQRDIISQIQRMDKVLNPAEEAKFLEELAAKRLGTHITYEEAQKISELSKRIKDTKGIGDRMDYGRSAVELRNYIDELKNNSNKFSLSDIKKNPLESLGKGAKSLADNTKAIKASMDNSAIFRQGWKTLWTNPTIWSKNALKSFKDIIQTFGKDEVMNELNADIVSRPNYDLMKKAKLDVGVLEEAFPTTLPEKIPVLGKFYKASENAYTAFVRRTRADVFDKYIEIAKKSGVELNDKELQSIGKLVNSLTGRGSFSPKYEKAVDVGNTVFFSPRFVKSQIDVLTQPFTGAGGSSFVRKQAAINLVKIIAGTAGVLTVANAVAPGSVEKDPRSSDFGKIKVGNTRFDVTGGQGSLITLAARLISNSTKSTTSGKVTPLNQKDKKGNPAYGAQTKEDVIVNFIEGKFSPLLGVVRDLAKGQDFSGNKMTIKNTLNNLLTPIPITTAIDSYKTPDSANLLLSLIADGLGISVNSYAPPKK